MSGECPVYPGEQVDAGPHCCDLSCCDMPGKQARLEAALAELTEARYALMLANDRVSAAQDGVRAVGATTTQTRRAVVAAYERRIAELRP